MSGLSLKPLATPILGFMRLSLPLGHTMQALIYCFRPNTTIGWAGNGGNECLWTYDLDVIARSEAAKCLNFSLVIGPLRDLCTDHVESSVSGISCGVDRRLQACT